MKRFLAASGITAFAIVALMLFARALPLDFAVETLQRDVEQALGARLQTSAEPQLSLVPYPMIHLPDVSLTGPDGNLLLTGRGLTARLSLMALLRGNLHASSITLDAPDIVIAIQRDGTMPWPGASRVADAVNQTETALPTIYLSRGNIAWQDLRDGSRITLSDYNGNLSVSRKGEVDIDGTFIWRREKVTVDLTIASLPELARDRWSDVEARITSPLGRVRFFGRFNVIAGLQLDGGLAVDSNAVDRLAVWLADDWNRSHWPSGALELKGQLKRLPQSISLTGVQLALGETSATGAAILKMNEGRPLLQGTLAADTLDLTPLLKRLLSYGATPSGWSRQDFRMASIRRFDTELRISAEDLIFGKLILKNSALLADARDGRLSLRLEEASTLGGMVAASFRATPEATSDSLAVQMALTGRGLALADVASLLGSPKTLDGRGTIQIDISGQGTTTDAIARSSSGKAVISAVDGAINGLNVVQQLQRLERSPLALGSLSGGQTSFAKLQGTVEIAAGTGILREFELTSPELTLAMAGSVDVATRSLDLSGTAARRDKEPPFVLPFKVTGDWRSPVVRPDVNMLLRRSGAAAPLFPATKAEPVPTQP